MKKSIYVVSACIAMISIILLSCEKKKDDPNRIAPTYKEESGYGTAGNPNVNNVTVTGTSTITNPATDNSSLYVGGSGWSNPTCSSTGSLTLKGINGNIDVTLSFYSLPTLGTATYNISSSPANNACAMTVQNAPNQPAGVVWYGKTGIVTVQTTTSSINANFSGVQCVQQSFNFPQVSVSGVLACN
ncbi:MAG: hypothetical protein H0W61_11165 [Bacteroidetes bacterium]|nr:hypothetical protein [Bacteroidota bacterium]